MKGSLRFGVIIFLGLLGSAGNAQSVWAQQEAVFPYLGQEFPCEITVKRTTLFEFSLGEGQWMEAQAGALFSTEDPTPEFTPAVLKRVPEPIRYPNWVVPEEWSKNFTIAVEVLPTGLVGRWHVTESTGLPFLDEAIVAAVRQWQFEPANLKGEVVVSCIQIPIEFAR